MNKFISKIKNAFTSFVNKIRNIKWKKVKTYLFGNGLKDGALLMLVYYALLIVIAFVFVEPILEMFFTSFKSSSDLVDPEVVNLPKDWMFLNYKAAYIALDYLTSLLNSVWFSLLLSVLQTIVSALTGYALARYKIKGAKFWWGLLIASFIIPAPMLILPRQIIFNTIFTTFDIKMVGTILPQLLLTLFGQGVYSTILILICYNFFKQIPYDLDEASIMDGASSIQTFYHIIFKLSVPIIITVFLFSFVWNWNDTLSMRYYLADGLQILPNQLDSIDNLLGGIANGPADKTNEAKRMAGTLISIIPLLIMYAFLQKQFVEGIEQTGLTGQ